MVMGHFWWPDHSQKFLGRVQVVVLGDIPVRVLILLMWCVITLDLSFSQLCVWGKRNRCCLGRLSLVFGKLSFRGNA